MTSVWMAYAVGLTFIAYLAALATEQLMWIWRRPRRVAWLAALIISVVAPVLIPVWRAGPHAAPMNELSTRPERQRLTSEPSRGLQPTMVATKSDSVGPVTTSAARRWALLAESSLPMLWLGASAVLFLFAAISYARLEWESASWDEAEIDGTRVMVSPNRGPAVFGIWRQRIVIPSWAISLDAGARALMLRHEREHLRARDAHCLLMAIVAAVLFPWNLGVWLIVRRLRVAIELDCDDRVLRGYTDPRTYGSLLLAVCARRSHEMRFAVALAERSSMLERRIKAMTAVRPRRRLLVSTALLCVVVVLSAAAAGTPSARPPSLQRHRALATASPIAANSIGSEMRKPSAPSKVARVARVDRHVPAKPAWHFYRLASPESLSRISATWENAPIESVIDAFAAFARRRITIAPNVGGFITATVVNQPWREALESLMATHELRVEFRADSSIYIAPLRESAPPPRESNATSMARTVSGTVDDARTGAPIGNVHINVAGTQLLDAPNEAESDERGRFALRVPDGEVWLDACVSGYEFRRVTLGPADTLAAFHGYQTAERAPSDTVRVQTKDIQSIDVVKGKAAALLYGPAAANGVVAVTTKAGTPAATTRGTPVFVIDGVVIGENAHRCSNEGRRLQFKVF